MCDVLESEAVTVTAGVEPRCAIDEEHCILDPMFFTQFGEKRRGDRGISRWK